MDADLARTFLLELPHVVETAQFGGILFWVGDKAIGGKMMCMMNPESGTGPPVSFASTAERGAGLLEVEGLIPAPYLARAHWVAAERWGALRNSQWLAVFAAAHEVTLAKLPPKTLQILALPAAEHRRILLERRALLAAKASKP